MESKVLTPRGFQDLKDMMDGLSYKLWNGERFVSKKYTVNFQDDIKLFKVELNNGNVFYCDEEYIPKIKDIYGNLPTLNPIEGMFDAFTRGLYAAQLHDEDENIIVTCKRNLLDKLKYDYYIFDNEEYRIHVNYNIKYFVPINKSMDAKINWLDGFFAGGHSIENNDVVIDGNIKLLRDISLLLQTCGINPRLYKNKLYIPLNELFRIGKFNFLNIKDNVMDFDFKYGLEIMSIRETEYDYTYQFE